MTPEKKSDLDSELQDIKKRLKVLEDIEEIKQLQYRYLNCVMFAKFDEIGDFFTDDAQIDLVEWMPETKGKAAVIKWFKDEIAKIHVGKEGDFEVHPIISVDGDKAKGNWVMYIMYFLPDTGQSLFWVQGIYDMEYARVDGKWKFSLMRWRERLGKPGGGPLRTEKIG